MMIITLKMGVNLSPVASGDKLTPIFSGGDHPFGKIPEIITEEKKGIIA